MNLRESSEVAVIVDGKWHAALCKALILSEASGEPYHPMFGKVAGWSEGIGIWLVPEKTYTSAGLSHLFIPWHSIITIAVIEEGQRKKPGFQAATA